MGLLNNSETESETNDSLAKVADKDTATVAEVKGTQAAGPADIPDATVGTAGAAQVTTSTAAPASATPASAPAADAAAVDAAASKTQALAPQAGRAVARTSRIETAYADEKDALPVEYNTLPQIILTNGNFVDRETKTVLGDMMGFDLISHQDAWVLSPEDDSAPNDVVKYSSDGKHTTEGVPVQEALDHMHKNGYPKARLKQRAVLVAAVVSASKSEKFNNTLVQLDLSPESKRMWDRHQVNLTYQLKIGVITDEGKNKLKAEAKLQTKGSNTYTYGEFSLRV